MGSKNSLLPRLPLGGLGDSRGPTRSQSHGIFQRECGAAQVGGPHLQRYAGRGEGPRALAHILHRARRPDRDGRGGLGALPHCAGSLAPEGGLWCCVIFLFLIKPLTITSPLRLSTPALGHTEAQYVERWFPQRNSPAKGLCLPQPPQYYHPHQPSGASRLVSDGPTLGLIGHRGSYP